MAITTTDSENAKKRIAETSHMCVCLFVCVGSVYRRCRFKIPKGSVAEREFLECVENRRTLMEKHEGFISASVESPLDELWVYSTRWVEKVRLRRCRNPENTRRLIYMYIHM